MSVIDHLEIAVTDAELSRQFYQQALAPLGFRLVITIDPAHNRTGGFRYGLGPDGYPRLWLHDSASTVAPVHVAFSAQERATVDQFWAAAIRAGGKDNGAPGIRRQYHDHYYAAYILDPDGNNLEVVCQQR